MNRSFLGTVLFLGVLLPLLQSGEIHTDFSRPGDRQIWYLNKWKGYMPLPPLKYDEKEQCLSVSDIKGEHGFGMACYRKHLPVTKGDKINVSFYVRGKGKLQTALQYFSNGKWAGCGRTVTAELSSQWQNITISLDVTDPRSKGVDHAIVTFGALRGSRLQVRRISAIPVRGKYPGNLPFPKEWQVFVPAAGNYSPSREELLSIPEKLNKKTGCRRQLLSNTIDFAKLTGKQQQGTCGWVFAQIVSPAEDYPYTIGAGADWWLTCYLNGKPVIDTMKTGNGHGKIAINNHIAQVKLKKGINILAVKAVTGQKSSQLMLGGPADLNTFPGELKTGRVLWSDDYDSPRSGRSGNPELIRSNISPGTFSQTGFGVYRTENTLDIFPGQAKYPSDTRSWFTMGLRLQRFTSPVPGKDSFSFVFMQKNKRFSLELTKKNQHILFRFLDNGTEIKRLLFPERLLPADIQLYFNRSGWFVLNISSLIDSSSSDTSGTAEFFRGVQAKDLTAKLTLSSSSGKKTEVIIDNWMTGLGVPGKKASAIPFKISPVKNFDPVKAGWKPVFSDEFNGSRIDRKKWDFHGDPRYISLDGKGHARIKTEPDAGGQLRSCVLLSKENFKYGWFEARLKFTKEPRCWSAFWLNHDFADNTNAFLEGVEIDIFEDYYIRSKLHKKSRYGVLDHNLHSRCGYTNLKSWNYVSELPRPLDDYFVIACKWTPFEISYYLDGKQISGTARHSPYTTVTFDPFHHVAGIMPLKVMFSGCIMGKGYGETNWLPQTLGKYPQYFMIDYVRVYAFPREKEPTVRLKGSSAPRFVPANSVLDIQADVSVNPQTKSPIQTVYLFDNGYCIASKSRPPYTFKIPFNAAFFRQTAYAKPGRGGQKMEFNGYPHTFVLFVQDADGKVAHSAPFTRIPVFGPSRPYRGVPREIPGKFFPGEYDEGGEGKAYHDSSRGNIVKKSFRPGEDVDCNETHLGFVLRHEWLSYTVNIRESGKYTVRFKYGTPLSSPQELILFLDGEKIGSLQFKQTKNWSCSSEAQLSGLQLPAGKHKFSMLINGRGFNLGEISFHKE
ncbi:MAG: family 16 glycosylhydrolase [Lentisphaeria bacterium]|nr:family 16 glycosylhydrolase [Lentisphaeria bacterium]